MQYQVPQFIEVEDKIFGPLTLKQFIYLAGGGGVCLIFFTLLPLFIAAFLSLPFVALALALAFYKVNDRPLIVAIEHGFKYFFGTKLYLWKQRPPTIEPAVRAPSPQDVSVPAVSENKLKDLAWSLNIKDQTSLGTIPQNKPGFKL